jgi:transcription initiation factor TFIIIB Brf1 subunit/transcription initiation factor TFIIB
MVLMLSSACSDVIVNALQELKIATYASLRQYDHTYSPDSYKSTLKIMEAKSQVKRIIFRVGKAEYYAWCLPWYENDAEELLKDLGNESITELQANPSTGKEMREYFRSKYPAYHQIAYLALYQLVATHRVDRLNFSSNGGWVTIYCLPEKKAVLDDLMRRTHEYVDRNGSAFVREVSELLGISTRLSFALLAALADQKRVIRFKVGWSYARYAPVYAYCKEGQESQAVVRYRRLVNKVRLQSRRAKVVDEYLSKFNSACRKIAIDEAVADLAGSYLERSIGSTWIKGRNPEVIAWSAYYLAAKVLRQGITLGEIGPFVSIADHEKQFTDRSKRKQRGSLSDKKRVLLTVSKDLNDFLQLSVPDLYPNPSDYVMRIILNMHLPDELSCSKYYEHRKIEKKELHEETIRVISSLPKGVAFGKRPESVAAAALYIAGKQLGVEDCIQQSISEASDITEVTLRNTLRAIEAALAPSDKGKTSEAPDHPERQPGASGFDKQDKMCAGCGLSEADGEKLAWLDKQGCWLCHDCAESDDLVQPLARVDEEDENGVS